MKPQFLRLNDSISSYYSSRVNTVAVVLNLESLNKCTSAIAPGCGSKPDGSLRFFCQKLCVDYEVS